MSDKKIKSKAPSKPKKSKKSRVKQLLIGSMIVGGVELMSEDAYAQQCHSDAECPSATPRCYLMADECLNYCY